MHYKKYS